jgi:uncharacterized protein (TIGR02001 family)
MKKASLIRAGIAACIALSGVQSAFAEDDFTITGNAGLFSDYRFRGISQTNNDIAFQGGFDLTHKSGFYAGIWNSNVGFGGGAAKGSGLETDIYGGYTFPVGKDVTLDVGLLKYVYSGTEKQATQNASEFTKFDTLETYFKASAYGFTGAFYYALSDDYFGTSDQSSGTIAKRADMSGSTYMNLAYKYSFNDKLSLTAAVGKTNFAKPVANNLEGTGLIDSYVDYSIGVTYNLSGFDLGLTYVDGNKNMEAIAVGAGGFHRDAGRGDVVLSLKKTF